MRGGRVVPVLAALMVMGGLSGCLSTQPPAPQGTASLEVQPLSASFPDARCDNTLLFQFVDYAETTQYLPPGFHPRDPRDFLKTPVAFGQAGVLFITVDCTSDQGRFSSASIDVFVQPPTVPGLPASTFDFYELHRYSNGTEFGGLLVRSGWSMLEGQPALKNAVGMTNQTALVHSWLNDTLGGVAEVNGFVMTPVNLGDSVVRFWNQGSQGLAYYEYDANLVPLVGPGSCAVREGSPLAAFTGTDPVPLGNGYVGCPSVSASGSTGEPVIATFPHLVLDARATALPGVFAA